MATSSPTTFTALGLLTVTTGLVDAATVLGFTVFAANMTGNVVFLGFSLGGSSQYPLVLSLSALVGFVVGSWVAGFIIPTPLAPKPASAALSLQTVLLSVGAVIAATASSGSAAWQDWLLLLVLGAAMGFQNVTSLASPVQDMKTTVLTLTIAGLAADVARGKQQKWGLRVVSVLLMLSGALGGALIFFSFGLAWTLVAAIVTAAASAILVRAGQHDAVWA